MTANGSYTRYGLRLRDQVDLKGLGADLEGVVGQAVAPTSLGLWVRGNEHAR